MSSVEGRSRSCSESSDTGDMVQQGMCVMEGAKGVGYDVDGKFSYSQVRVSIGKLISKLKAVIQDSRFIMIK